MMSQESTRRRGRPALVEGQASISVTVAVPSKQYRELEQQAQRQRLELRDWIRRKLRDDDE